jgi:MFS family permease
MIVFSIGEVMIIPAEFLLVDSIAPEAQRGAYHGAMGFAALGSAIGPALGGGLLVWFGGAVAFAALAVIALLAVVAFGRGRAAPPPTSAGALVADQRGTMPSSGARSHVVGGTRVRWPVRHLREIWCLRPDVEHGPDDPAMRLKRKRYLIRPRCCGYLSVAHPARHAGLAQR